MVGVGMCIGWGRVVSDGLLVEPMALGLKVHGYSPEYYQYFVIVMQINLHDNQSASIVPLTMSLHYDVLFCKYHNKLIR